MRLELMRRIGSPASAPVELSGAQARTVQMLAYQVDGRHDQLGDHAAFLRRLAANPASGEELAELADVLQSTASLPSRPILGLEDTPSGRRYLDSAGNGWRFQLFVRTRKRSPYRACGGVGLEQAEGDRPLSIVWRLETPLPVRLFAEFSVLRGA